MGAKRFTGAVLALALVLTPGAAHADVLPAGNDDQRFTNGQGGWTASSTSAGLCVPAVTCATVTNDFVPSGGTAGPSDGYIRSQFGAVLTTFAGTTTGVWTGPTFVYDGNGGSTPAAVELDLSIRPQVESLLGLDLLNQASYRVDLVDLTGSIAITAVPPTPLTADSGWTAVPTASITPALMTIGHTYQIRVSASYSSVVTLLATGEVGFDDITLTTYGAGTGRGGGGAADGAKGTDGAKGVNGGSGITTAAQLRTITKSTVLPRTVRQVGKTVRVKVRCPRKAAPHACKTKIRGLAKGKKSKVATKVRSVTVKAGKKKVVKLKVKPKYRARYRDARKVTLKSRVKVGDVKVVVTKRVKVRR